MNPAKMRLGIVTSRMFAENAYFAHLEGRSDCLVFDPGFDTDELLAYLHAQRLSPAAILNTHGHADHIAGNETLKRCYPEAPLIIGAGDAVKLQDPEQNLSAPFGIELTSPPADQLVREGDRISFAGIDLEVYDTPGHSSGHVIFVARAVQPIAIFAGDVLMKRSVGRTDFPDGDMAQLERSIRTKIYTLPDSAIVLPGHGEPTSVGDEKRFNPFVREIA